MAAICRPCPLAVAGEHLLAVGRDRTKLFRVALSGATDMALLLDEEDRPLVEFAFGYGGLLASEGRAWLASGERIVALDLERLHWRPVTSP